MLSRGDLHTYQRRAVSFVTDHPRCALFLGMGLGKTVSTLTAVADLMYYYFTVRRVLVIAPLRVARDTWADEVDKWEHLSGLTISVAVGTAKERRAALERNADVYVINRENVVWLINNYKWQYDMVVIDELSSFKAASSKRFKALRKVIPSSSRVVGLTGTPAPNSLMDLWSQMYLIDTGERLGRTLTAYRGRWFRPGKSKGYVVYEWIPRQYAGDQITSAISDIAMSMSSEELKGLPDVNYITIPVRLSDDVMDKYRELKQDMITSLPEGTLTASSAVVLSGRLKQFTGGAVYHEDDNTRYYTVHDDKLEALKELIEFADSPVLVAYEYRHERERILQALKDVKGVEVLDTADSLKRWKSGEIAVGLGHPASLGHGLNLQSGGHIIVWYGLTWSLELYQQYNARLHRQGQTEQVQIYHLVAKGTIDERILKVLESKDNTQQSVLNAVREELEA